MNYAFDAHLGTGRSPLRFAHVDPLMAEGFPAREVPFAMHCLRYSRIVDGHRHIWDVHRVLAVSQYREHARLLQETDLAYPVILSANGDVMDGIHRACKALIEGKAHMDAVQFADNPVPDHFDANLNDLPYDDVD